jgi:hypothetical protein
MRKLSQETKDKIDSDPFYKKCCICSSPFIQIHHNLIFAGRQVDDAECLLPLCEKHHEMARNSEFKERLDIIMFKRMKTSQFNKYGKGGLSQRYLYLSSKYNENYNNTKRR